MRRSQPLLGTFITISAYGENEERAQAAVTAAFEEIRRVDEVLSIHKPESEVSRLNKAAAERPVEISEELRFVLATAQRIAQETGGAFDPTIGPLAQLWGFIWKEYRLPTKEELDRVLRFVNYQQVTLSTNDRRTTVRFGQAGMFLDFGGIGKGYAVDRAIAVLREHSVQNAMVKAGGDLRVIGSPPGESGWEVQIEDPEKEGKRATVRLRDQALSTSGDYENFFEIGGRRYSHILNPRSGVPVRGIVSCTVTAGSCMESDAYATAFFVLGIEESLDRFGRRLGIRFVDTDVNIRQTERFP